MYENSNKSRVLTGNLRLGEGDRVESGKRGRGDGFMDMDDGGLSVKKGKGEECFFAESNFVYVGYGVIPFYRDG